jgi:hypothetical protein
MEIDSELTRDGVMERAELDEDEFDDLYQRPSADDSRLRHYQCRNSVAVSRSRTKRWTGGSRISIATYSDAIHQAFRDWNDGRAYTDGRNYRVKLGTSTSGPIASWNREVKRLFATCSEFHRAAKEVIGDGSEH